MTKVCNAMVTFSVPKWEIQSSKTTVSIALEFYNKIPFCLTFWTTPKAFRMSSVVTPVSLCKLKHDVLIHYYMMYLLHDEQCLLISITDFFHFFTN